MGHDAVQPVAVSRQIGAPAGRIFEILADPGRHPEIDGSGMLRTGGTTPVVSATGDVFVMHMHHPTMGDYKMDNHVVAYELNRRIGWEPAMHGEEPSPDTPHRNGSRWLFELSPEGPGATLVTETYDCSNSPDSVRQAVDDGRNWTEAMATTLQQLDDLCTGAAGAATGRPAGAPLAR